MFTESLATSFKISCLNNKLLCEHSIIYSSYIIAIVNTPQACEGVDRRHLWNKLDLNPGTRSR